MLPSQKQPHVIRGVVGFGRVPRGNLLDLKCPTEPSRAETKLRLTLAFPSLILPRPQLLLHLTWLEERVKTSASIQAKIQCKQIYEPVLTVIRRARVQWGMKFRCPRRKWWFLSTARLWLEHWRFKSYRNTVVKKRWNLRLPWVFMCADQILWC